MFHEFRDFHFHHDGYELVINCIVETDLIDRGIGSYEYAGANYYDSKIEVGDISFEHFSCGFYDNDDDIFVVIHNEDLIYEIQESFSEYVYHKLENDHIQYYMNYDEFDY